MPRMSVFWAKVEKTQTCWIWRGLLLKGYGKYSGTLAHRVSYEALVGPIPKGLEIDHLCRQTLCVNPAHLEPVTRAENQRRRSASITRCVNGHEFTPENTYFRTDRPTNRQCRACNRHVVARRKAAA